MCSVFRPRANIGYCKLIVTRFVNCVCLGISSSTVIRLDVINSVPWEDWACESSEDDDFSPISTFLVFISSMIILSFFYSFSQVCKANMESIWHANVCAHSCMCIPVSLFRCFAYFAGTFHSCTQPQFRETRKGTELISLWVVRTICTYSCQPCESID